MQELNGVSGIAGVGGVAVGAGSLTFLSGTAALAVTGLGAFLVVGAIGYAVYRATPQPLQRPEDLVGKTISLETLSNTTTPIPRLAIIGVSQAGKTTLRSRLAVEPVVRGRTQQMTAQVISLQTSPPTFLAILDGGGERFPQQFKLAETCDYLCIVLDHNQSDTLVPIERSRMEEHEAFLRQVRHHLDQAQAAPVKQVHMLLNKHDLWKQAPVKKQSELLKFCADEAKKWKDGKNAESSDFKSHSNENPEDIAQLMNLLKKLVSGT